MWHLILSSNNFHKEIDVENAEDIRSEVAKEAKAIDQAIDVFTTEDGRWLATVSPADAR